MQYLVIACTIMSVLAGGASAGAAQDELGPSAWRFVTHEPAADWATPGYDDAHWTHGEPGFGSQTLPEFQRERVRTRWETSEIWIRFAVDVAEAPWWSALTFSHDEDVEIFINGRPVLARKGYTTRYETVYLDGELDGIVQPGRNVVAAHCRQTGGGQFLDIALEAFAGDGRITATAGDVPRPEYPRPELRRDDWLCLNGEWEFEIDREGTGQARGLHRGVPLAGSIIVPFAPESPLSGVGETDFLRNVWYFRGVRVPPRWAGKRVLLHFGAVDYRTIVWVNGREAGRHRGGFTPFAVDITPHIRGGYAGITVLAEDPMTDGLQATGKQSRRLESYGCVYTRTTGIWQTVWLEALPEVSIRSLRLEPLPDQRQVLIRVETEGQRPGAALRVAAAIAGKPAGDLSVPLRGRSTIVALPLSRVALWGPGSPVLYDLDVQIEAGGAVLDGVRSYFGLRSIDIDGLRVLINGEPVFQRLVLDQGYYPDGIYTAPTDEALKRGIELSMEAGFNGARLHMKVFEPRFLYWADRLGYLVWGEFPNWGLDHSDPAAHANLLGEWLEALDRDRNHPAIIGWCPYNETPGDQWGQGIQTAYLATKAADPTRPVIDTSGYVHVETDIYDCHNYSQEPEEFRAAFEPFKAGRAPWHNSAADAPYTGQPFMVSEFGGARWAPGLPGWGYGHDPKTIEEFHERFEALCAILMDNPNMFGFCYTQLYDIEQEVNGIFTYDRQAKFELPRIRAVLERKAAIER